MGNCRGINDVCQKMALIVTVESDHSHTLQKMVDIKLGYLEKKKSTIVAVVEFKGRR